MHICKTTLSDVWLIKPDIFEDFRGHYVMTYHQKQYAEIAPYPLLIEHDISTTRHKGTIRGIHYSPNCWKLYEISRGAVYYVIVNCEIGHQEFGKWEAFILSDQNHYQILKHPRYGAGFLTLTDDVVLHYMQSQYYNKDDPDQRTFKWNDPLFNIWWPQIIPHPILSRRDEEGKYGFGIES